MPRSINQVKGITLIIHLYRMRFDRDAALFLQVHIVQHLVLHLPHINGARQFQHAIRQGTLTVVDMRDDTKITYILH